MFCEASFYHTYQTPSGPCFTHFRAIVIQSLMGLQKSNKKRKTKGILAAGEVK